MIARTVEDLRGQAGELAARLSAARPKWEIGVVDTVSYLGSGSLPGYELPSVAVRISTESAERLALGLRTGSTSVVPRVKDDVVLLDMRTVFPDQLDAVVQACGAL